MKEGEGGKEGKGRKVKEGEGGKEGKGRKVKEGEGGKEGKGSKDKLDKLYDWAGRWQMESNVGTCSILSVGRNNPSHNYSLNGTPLSTSDCERDLRVLASADPRHRAQCTQGRYCTNRVLGFISRSVSNTSADVILKLYLDLIFIMRFSSGLHIIIWI